METPYEWRIMQHVFIHISIITFELQFPALSSPSCCGHDYPQQN
ncbi:hypothetical protein HanXRQr2_Chr02g0086071 [Helianthus annuus]|uniref:Uncharacterized protein n=1 Tax=Helianthus annuus TaxID=4232 RepID=A0A9K3JQZ2_HELAN|nr:hypothetical protein HanXRQr2_Chr02g0086071 [Helianthus annuus]